MTTFVKLFDPLQLYIWSTGILLYFNYSMTMRWMNEYVKLINRMSGYSWSICWFPIMKSLCFLCYHLISTCDCLLHTNCYTSNFKIHEMILIGTDLFILLSLITMLFQSSQDFQSLDWMVVEPSHTQRWSVSWRHKSGFLLQGIVPI